MKKNFFLIIGVAAFAVAVALNINTSLSNINMLDVALANVEALASAESDSCPNGCKENGDGCYCNGWYPCYREA